MLTDDVLMSYLLPIVDKGKGMMKMLDKTPIDYVTWGNHENGMAHADVLAREKEYKGFWINSDMTSQESFTDSTCQTDSAIVDLSSMGGIHRRKIGTIGVMTDTPTEPSASGGAMIEDPWYGSSVQVSRFCRSLPS